MRNHSYIAPHRQKYTPSSRERMPLLFPPSRGPDEWYIQSPQLRLQSSKHDCRISPQYFFGETLRLFSQALRDYGFCTAPLLVPLTISINLSISAFPSRLLPIVLSNNGNASSFEIMSAISIGTDSFALAAR